MSPSSQAPIVEAHGISKVFGAAEAGVRKRLARGRSLAEATESEQTRAALRDVSVSIRRGEIYAIMGLSGSGKSTLVRCLNGLIAPTAGEVTVAGTSLVKASAAQLREVRQRRMTMVFQSFALLPHLSVVDNVRFGLKLRGDNAAQGRARALACIDMVGLHAWAERRVDELSGGMKQRVGLARALAPDPDILIMDEPFSALDPLIRLTLQDELLRLQSELQKTIVFVTHDFDEAARIGNRVLIMKDGEVVQVGTPTDIVTRPANDYVGAFAARADVLRFVSMGQLLRVLPSAEAAGAVGAEACATDTPLTAVLGALRLDQGLAVRTEEGAVRLVPSEAILQYVGELYAARES